MHVAECYSIRIGLRRKQKVKRLSGVLALSLFVMIMFTGCVALTGKTAGRNIDDATITASVKTNLAAAGAATLTKVDVDTNNGVVSLNGVVDSAAMKERAAQIARQTSGVQGVVNNLQVQSASR
jgi:hyperosmotically inducible protein